MSHHDAAQRAAQRGAHQPGHTSQNDDTDYGVALSTGLDQTVPHCYPDLS
jgi:hypothetical protein